MPDPRAPSWAVRDLQSAQNDFISGTVLTPANATHTLVNKPTFPFVLTRLDAQCFGGSSTLTINIKRNGSTVATMSVTTTSLASPVTIADEPVDANDKLEIEIASVTGSPTSVFFQLSMQRGRVYP